MKPRRILAAEDTSQILDEAARDNTLAVVTIQNDGGWQTVKSRFLERDPDRRFFVLDYQPQHDAELPVLRPGQYVGVSFRRKSRKVLFTTVIEATGSFLLDDQSSIAAVRYRWPESMTELQRRAYYRTPVPGGVNLLANLWEGGRNARASAQSNTLQVVTGLAKDLSCGGALIRVNQVSGPSWAIDQTLGVELCLPDGRPPLLADAYFRGVRHDGAGNLCIAIQFVGLELMVEGEVVLERIVKCIQRFNRLAFAAGHREGNHGSRNWKLGTGN
jgi:c-di-GMP-binding flagellar brake protein YcgR